MVHRIRSEQYWILRGKLVDGRVADSEGKYMGCSLFLSVLFGSLFGRGSVQ